ncbi:MAG: sigma-70 family RNA polymerase sigma factor [Thermoleophilia bacterium]|nr:sigma-70 family RNA polymerase sigma factor [Thermoleophilia bacterium]
MDTVLSTRLHVRAEAATITAVSAPEVTDGTLIEQIARGERSAFEELYHRYARSVLGFALRRIGDRGRAEDSVQDVFAAVWRSAASYDRKRGPGGAWLYTIARNAIVDAQRRKPAPTMADPPEVVSTELTPDEEAEASWNSWRVHRTLETLPETERTVIDLAYFSGLSQSEIAGFLDVPLGTVKTRTRSGLARLADALECEL